jgi:CubicO group peptidase (beta-lactamase class C family)
MATKDIDLEFRSNSRFGYCNTNYAMLALVIEKITNLSYQDAMKNCFQTIRNDKHLCI